MDDPSPLAVLQCAREAAVRRGVGCEDVGSAIFRVSFVELVLGRIAEEGHSEVAYAHVPSTPGNARD